ncbi:MAG: DUF87 domain-containing protein [Thermoplasmata archaeon]
MQHVGDMHIYRFRPVPSLPSPEELRLFTGRLRRALRGAHGLGIPIHLQWSSDPMELVSVTVPGGIGARWMQFGLSTAYELGQWQNSAGPGLPIGAWAGLGIYTSGSAELPFPAPFDESPWCEVVLAELSTARAGVSIDWDLRPDSGPPVHEPPPARSSGTPLPDTRMRSLPERALQDRQDARRTGLRWRVDGRVRSAAGLVGRDASARVARLLEIASHLDGGNRFVCRPLLSPVSRLRPGSVLTEAELVGLFPPPSSNMFSCRGVDSPGRGRLWLGRDLSATSVGLPVDPGQGRHLLILGETGMGKSSLVVRLAWQAARWGSVILFDPIGDTARDFLTGLSGARSTDVSWVSPAFPGLSVNVLREIASSGEGNPARRDRLLADVVASLRRVRAGRYAESSFWGPRLEEMLFQALRAASYWPGASLALAERLLTPGGFSFRSVPGTAREAVSEVRRRIDNTPQDGDGARRLLSEITRSEVLREMLDSEVPSWSVSSAVLSHRTTVISGDAPQVGESVSRFLLAIILALVWNAVLGRRESPKTFLILDEAQWYAHDSVAEMLRLGRRFNLHVWAATQSLGSFPESVRDAFMTNSADLVLFRGDPDDARQVGRWVPHLAPERVMRLAKGEAAVLIDKGTETHWIHLRAPIVRGGDPARFAPRIVARTPEARSEGAIAPLNVNSEPPGTSAECPPPLETTPFLAALRELVQSGGDRSELTVRLADLRSRWSSDPDAADRWVRSGGRFLSTSGALLRTGRDGEGSFWVVSRDRLAQVLAEEIRGPDHPIGA